MMVLTESGNIYTMGLGISGRLGDGTETWRNTPTIIAMPFGETFKSISAGYYYSMAITESEKLYTWGENNYGELGDGTMEERWLPTFIRSN